LARIHRYTLKRLRQEIKPVAPACLMRFLFEWQGVKPARGAAPAQLAEGEAALANVLAQLEGFELAAGAWEADVLPARLRSYEPAWLDNLCAAGRIRWARLSPPPSHGKSSRASGAGPVRGTPIALVSRQGLGHWRVYREDFTAFKLSGSARAVLDCLASSGALFFDELKDATGLLRTQLEQALAELAAAGLVSSDSFAGLRSLLMPAHRRKPIDTRRRRRGALYGVEDAGRWSRLSAPPSSNGKADYSANAATVEYIAACLLRRYGIVFRALLLRESGIPPWRELLYVYRRMEARGEVRGGRFAEGFSGEQFALPHAVGLLREINRRSPEGELIAVSAADPLNMVGSIVPGARVPSLTANRVLYRDGAPIATVVGRQTQWLESMTGEAEWQARSALLRRRMPDYVGTDGAIRLENR
jgi:ATP-dependent Lhr-like helicase